MPKLLKVIFVVGPTASGKTDLGIFLAQKFNGEVVSADSRQVYKEMNIGTAKPSLVPGDVAHHLLDVVSPSEIYTLADFKKQAESAIADILDRGKLPIVVGGTGLYIWSLVDNLDIPSAGPDQNLRESLNGKSLEDLVEMLKELDFDSYEIVDLKNKRRVLRALEVAISTGESFAKQTTKSAPLYDCLQIGINLEREVLYKRINNRIDQQIEQGLVEETQELIKKYLFDLPSMSSLGYRQITQFLRGDIGKDEMLENFKRDTRHYAKRQLSWFRRDKRIVWVDADDKFSVEKMVKDFLEM